MLHALIVSRTYFVMNSFGTILKIILALVPTGILILFAWFWVGTRPFSQPLTLNEVLFLVPIAIVIGLIWWPVFRKQSATDKNAGHKDFGIWALLAVVGIPILLFYFFFKS